MPSDIETASFAELVADFGALVGSWGAAGDLINVVVAPISFADELADGEALPGLAIDHDVTFPANFGGSTLLVGGGAPSATTVLTIEAFHGGMTTILGTITIGTDKAVTSATTGSAAVTASAPGAIRLRGPTPAITGLTDFVGGLIGRIAA